MRKTMLICVAVLALSAIPCYARHKPKSYAPLPPQLMAAKTVCIENQGAVEITDRVYGELKQWGRFQVVSGCEKSDLVLSFRNNPPGVESRTSLDHAYMEVQDPQTRAILYNDEKVSSFNRAIHLIIEGLRKRIEAQQKLPDEVPAK